MQRDRVYYCKAIIYIFFLLIKRSFCVYPCLSRQPVFFLLFLNNLSYVRLWCITRQIRRLFPLHKGRAAWKPSGGYIFFIRLSNAQAGRYNSLKNS